jgi:hypothetical protein
MISGHFELTLKNAEGLCDGDFGDARRQGKLQELLDGLRTDAEYGTDNLLFDFMVPWFGYWLFGGTAPNSWIAFGSSSTATMFYGVCLLTLDSDPDYQNEWIRSGSGGDFTAISNVASSADSVSGGKMFVQNASESADIRSDPNGREAVYYRERWLFLPLEAVSSNIRSIGVYSGSSGTIVGTNSDFHIRSGRVRIKDSGGNPVIISKANNQVLLVEYKASFVSI